MGHVYVDITFTNPGDPALRLESRALVDTGATFSVIPAVQAEALGLEKIGRQAVRTAAGLVEMDMCWAMAQVGNRRGPAVLFISPVVGRVLVGVFTLEGLRLSVDPVSGELRELELLLF